MLYVAQDLPEVDTIAEPDPFNVTTVSLFVPRHVTRRLMAQSGMFTIHPHPEEPLCDDMVDRIIIPEAQRREFKIVLYRYGIHSASLFPDLDGLCAHLKWLREDSRA